MTWPPPISGAPTDRPRASSAAASASTPTPTTARAATIRLSAEALATAVLLLAGPLPRDLDGLADPGLRELRRDRLLEPDGSLDAAAVDLATVVAVPELSAGLVRLAPHRRPDRLQIWATSERAVTGWPAADGRIDLREVPVRSLAAVLVAALDLPADEPSAAAPAGTVNPAPAPLRSSAAGELLTAMVADDRVGVSRVLSRALDRADPALSTLVDVVGNGIVSWSVDVGWHGEDGARGGRVAGIDAGVLGVWRAVDGEGARLVRSRTAEVIALVVDLLPAGLTVGLALGSQVQAEELTGVGRC